MIHSPNALQDFLQKFEDPAWEPFYDEYRDHLLRINEIALASGEPVEGNLFFDQDSDEPLSEIPFEPWRAKRRNFALFSSAGDGLLEIGFNAGHSCLLALTANKELCYTGIDIGSHGYTVPCFEYLRSAFGPRVHLIVEDSRDVLPVLRDRGESFDLYHVDGGHDFGTLQADVETILAMGSGEATILVDDTWLFHVDHFCDHLLLQGRFSRIELSRLWSATDHHRIFRTHPKPRISAGAPGLNPSR